jgi:hypothetical protein
MHALRAPFSIRVAGLVWLATISAGASRPAGAQGPVAVWGFGEGSGAVVADASGNANHGSVSGATWTTGKYGSALAFNGTGALVTVADSASLDLSTGMTLEAWVYPTATAAAWKDVIYKAVDIYYLEGSSPAGNAPSAGGTFAAQPVYGPVALPLNAWSHLASTYDGATLRLYVNGAQVASRAQTGPIQTSAGNLTLGGDAAFGQYWAGRIDEVRIYNGALSASQIQTDMNTPIGPGPTAPPVPPPATGTTLSWQQPAGSAPVDEFRVYKGPALDRGTLVYAGMPAPDAQGVFAASVQIDEIAQNVPVYVWLTAANATGESAPSNANFYPEGCDPAVDSDCDGVPDDGAAGNVRCATGQTVGCDDNCPYWPNPGQEDNGGISTTVPDGIGDACQCGDVSGDGRVTSADSVIIKRALVIPPRAVMAHPERCDVGGSAACTSADSVIVQRALSTPPRATIFQQCDPALMP